MLHTDCALCARLRSVSPELHESAAAEIARMLRDDEGNRDFARRWYEVMAGLASGGNRWPDALEWVERGLRDFPDSAELLLVLGAMRETAATLAAPPESRELRQALVDPNTLTTRAAFLHSREVREHLDEARRALRAAVTAAPSLADARLRLGRVQWRVGDSTEARSLLEGVLAGDPPATLPSWPVSSSAACTRMTGGSTRPPGPTRPRSCSSRRPSRPGWP
jgi:tetratricopeptide (TPR) repeat protein